MKAECKDCKKPYEEFSIDVVLSDKQWEVLSCEKEGLLCGGCIIEKASKIKDVVKIELNIVFKSIQTNKG